MSQGGILVHVPLPPPKIPNTIHSAISMYYKFQWVTEFWGGLHLPPCDICDSATRKSFQTLNTETQKMAFATLRHDPTDKGATPKQPHSLLHGSGIKPSIGSHHTVSNTPRLAIDHGTGFQFHQPAQTGEGSESPFRLSGSPHG